MKPTKWKKERKKMNLAMATTNIYVITQTQCPSPANYGLGIKWSGRGNVLYSKIDNSTILTLFMLISRSEA